MLVIELICIWIGLLFLKSPSRFPALLLSLLAVYDILIVSIWSNVLFFISFKNRLPFFFLSTLLAVANYLANIDAIYTY